MLPCILLHLLAQASAHCPSVYSLSSENTFTVRTGNPSTPSVQRFDVPYDCISIPGATWIWESNASTRGTFTYVRTFRLTDCALAALTSLKLSISADDCFSVVFNGHIIAP